MISDSYSAGNASGWIVVGGFVGQNPWGKIINCYANVGVGSVAGHAFAYYSLSGSIESSYYVSDTSGGEDRGIPRTVAEMMKRATFVGWDFQQIWDIDEDGSFPYLRKVKEKEGLVWN